MRVLSIAALLASTINALPDIDEKAISNKVDEAKSKWQQIREHTKAMLEKVHDQMNTNLKKLEEDREKQKTMLDANLAEIDRILKKDASLRGTHASFIQEQDIQRSPEEEQAISRTQKLLKELDDIVHGRSSSVNKATAASFAELASEDPAIKALKEAQKRMIALQEKLHNQAMSLSLTQ